MPAFIVCGPDFSACPHIFHTYFDDVGNDVGGFFFKRFFFMPTDEQVR